MFIFPISDDNPTTTKPFVSWSLILTCIFIFLYHQSLNNELQNVIFLTYGMIPSVLFGIEELPPYLNPIPSFFTLFTSMFLHGGWMHLLGNMGYLYIFGDNIEDCMGKFRFIIFFFLCGLIAAISQSVINVNSIIPMVGASGAISGVLGGYLVLYPRTNIKVFCWFLIFIKTFNIPAMFVLGGWIIIQFFSFDNNASDGGVAYAAHIGGFISGMILIKIFKKRQNKNYEKLEKGSLPSSK